MTISAVSGPGASGLSPKPATDMGAQVNTPPVPTPKDLAPQATDAKTPMPKDLAPMEGSARMPRPVDLLPPDMSASGPLAPTSPPAGPLAAYAKVPSETTAAIEEARNAPKDKAILDISL